MPFNLKDFFGFWVDCPTARSTPAIIAYLNPLLTALSDFEPCGVAAIPEQGKRRTPVETAHAYSGARRTGRAKKWLNKARIRQAVLRERH